MIKVTKTSLQQTMESLEYLPDRMPQMGISGSADGSFAQLSEYGDGAIHVGCYSGGSEWERHTNGDDIVMAERNINFSYESIRL